MEGYDHVYQKENIFVDRWSDPIWNYTLTSELSKFSFVRQEHSKRFLRDGTETILWTKWRRLLQEYIFFMSQYQISWHVQWILLNFVLTVPFLVMHAASILVFHIYCCGSLGQICLFLCLTLIFLKHCALFDYIIFLLRHLSSINYQLIELENFVFYSWASEIWLHISFSSSFSPNKKQKASMPERLVY